VCYQPTGGIGVAGHLRCEIVEGHRYADDPEPSWYAGPSQHARSTDPEVSGSHPAGPYDSGIHERPSGAFRLPEQRPSTGPYGAAPDPVTSTGSHARPGEPEARAAYDSVRVPIRGPEYPTIRPTGAEPPAGATTYGSAAPESLVPLAEPTSLVPPIGNDRGLLEKPNDRDLLGKPNDRGLLGMPNDRGLLENPDDRGRFAKPAESVYSGRRPVSSFIVAGVMVVLLLPVARLLLDATFTGSPSARDIVPAVLLTLGFALTGIGLFAVASGRPLGRDAWLRPPVAYLPAGLILLLAAGLAVA
jgi:hypothetical protein